MIDDKIGIMRFPILAYKEKADLKLYGFKEEIKLKHTSRELLKARIFNGVFIIDSDGRQYQLKNVREVGWANAFWGISIMRKSRQIIIDYDLDFVSQKSFDDVKEFVLARLKQGEKDPLSIEICDNVKNANSIKQIISYFI